MANTCPHTQEIRLATLKSISMFECLKQTADDLQAQILIHCNNTAEAMADIDTNNRKMRLMGQQLQVSSQALNAKITKIQQDLAEINERIIFHSVMAEHKDDK